MSQTILIIISLQILCVQLTLWYKKHGKWIEDEDGDGKHCSVCGVDYCDLVTYNERFYYCPNCGAKMDL